jgi:tetratricopeptide (TPR) repeat protein
MSVDFAPHRADIYALGVVLLETLTGWPPVYNVSPVTLARTPAPRTVGVDSRVCAEVHRRSARTLIHDFESRSGCAIARGLSAILERCLDPDPAGRYCRAWELAEDLDRWRCNRPLIFTIESVWRQKIPRWLKRHRRRLASITAGISFLIGLPLTSVVSLRSTANLQENARYKLACLWDDPIARAYDVQRQPAIRLLKSDHSHVAAAARALNDYRVVGPDDWRQRDDVRCLPQAERDDLELWLMGQAYVYCRAMENRPNSPDDWRRALKILNRLDPRNLVPVLAAMRSRLNVKLGNEPSSSPPVSTRSIDPLVTDWVNEYLLGLVVECESEFEPRNARKPSARLKVPTASPDAIAREGDDPPRSAAARALNHYSKLLSLCPDSYWGHYRAAATAFGLGGVGNLTESARHLEQCLKRRPGNPTIQGLLATCLMELNQTHEAAQEIEKAIAGAPDLAELYRTRAFIRTTFTDPDRVGLADDLEHFEVLSRLLPLGLLAETSADANRSSMPTTLGGLRFPVSLDLGIVVGNQSADLDRFDAKVELDPQELFVRATLALRIGEAGALDVAAFELGKMLILEPDQIAVRMSRAILSIDTRRFQAAARDLEAVLTSPGLIEHVKNDPNFIRRFHHASRRYSLNGKLQEARELARRTLDLSIALGLPRAESHYNLARTYAMSARADSQFVAQAADQLHKFLVAHPSNQSVYARDPAFAPVRHQIDEHLRSRPDPAALYHQRLSAPPAKTD